MELVSYFFRFLYRIKWWLIIFPLVVAVIVIFETRHLSRSYEVKTTIYTGVVSGYNIDPEGTVRNITLINNTIDNLINIITAKSTLRQVSMRLFAQHMMHGDPNSDNNYIQAKNYRHLIDITPQKVKDLIDKKSEERTLAKLFEFADSDTQNFLYGLFNWAPPYYSYDALSHVMVRRLGNSDMIEIHYTTDDPGIAYNTLELLNQEFMKQYESLQFGETDKVIRFFEEELSKTGSRLRISEDSLTSYNIQKKIINYDEQTKHLAALSRDFELQKEDILLQHNSAQALVKELEKRIGEGASVLRNNSIFINKLKEISDLSAQIAQTEAFENDSVGKQKTQLSFIKNELQNKEKEFKNFSDNFTIQKNSKEGYPTVDLIRQWLAEVLKQEEAKAKLDVMERWQTDLDKEYVYYSPIGSTINRKEREINFTEASYMEILHSLNTARLRQKSLQMNSATLKVLNPPTYPLSSAPTKRKLKIITAFVASFIFIFGYFLLLEILDHTLRDKIRAERITSGKVVGALPRGNKLRHRGYNKTVITLAIKALGIALLRYMSPGKRLIINLISMEKKEGKSFVSDNLASYFSSIGLRVSRLSWHEDFSPATSEYLLAQQLDDLTDKTVEQVILVEHPPLSESAVPVSLLQVADVNLLVLRSTRTWKNSDRILFRSLTEEALNSPVLIVLNKTKKEEAEYFTGLLPPYTFIRKLIFRISQLGLTSVE